MKIAIASGKGGTGKTTLAVALKLMLADAIYVDMDVEEPNGKFFLKPSIKKQDNFNELVPEINTDICTFCGKCADICAYNAISIIKPLKKALFFKDLCHSCGACSYVCPVEGAIVEKDVKKGVINYGRIGDSKQIDFVEGLLDVGEPSSVSLIGNINKIISQDDSLYILDAPPGTSCPVVATLEDVDYVVLVTEPTPFGLNDLKLALDVVKNLKKPHGMVINKYDEKYQLGDEFAKENNVEILGKIPFDRKVAENYSNGVSLNDMSEELKNELLGILKKIKQHIPDLPIKGE